MSERKCPRRWPVALLLLACISACAPGNRVEPRLVLIDADPTPVLETGSGAAEPSVTGFSGGRVVKLADGYHLVTTEMVAADDVLATRLAHWTSEAGTQWQRVDTLVVAPLGAGGSALPIRLRAPLPVFDPASKRWSLFYAECRGEAPVDTNVGEAAECAIHRVVSQTAGRPGIGGPYAAGGLDLGSEREAGSARGIGGSGSFLPFAVGEHWAAFFGSAGAPSGPVGIAGAPALAGPWKPRVPTRVTPIAEKSVGFPIVLHDRSGVYLAVYDDESEGTIGYSFSSDGFHWSPGRSLETFGATGSWAAEVRDPLGLVPEDRNLFTVFFTGLKKARSEEGEALPASCAAVGRARVRLVWEPVNPYRGTSQ